MHNIDKAIILVAGMGSRLGPLTATTPKCLVEVNGTPILVNALNQLDYFGFKEAVIVVGYMGDMIKDKVGDQYKGVEITYIDNDIFDKTNNMYSLFLAKEHLNGPNGVLLIEGDSYFEQAVLERLLSTDSKSYWAADRFDLFKDGCMLTTNDNESIQKIEIIRYKLSEYKNNQHKSGDIIKIMPDLGKLLAGWLDYEVRNGNVNIYYDVVFAEHLSVDQIYICDINGLKWMEIDDYYDLRQAERTFSSSNDVPFEKKYEIVPIDQLRPLEYVFPNHLKNLTELILRDGFVKAPLLADRETGIVLDGSHRYVFFLQQGYETVPVHFVNYKDENIRVGTRLLHRHLIDASPQISKREVIERGLSGNIFRARTTRNFFPFRKITDMNLPLSALEKGDPRIVDHYIEKVSKEDEIKHNKEFIQEIEQEMDEIVNFLYEAKDVKDYLKFQVQEMEKPES